MNWKRTLIWSPAIFLAVLAIDLGFRVLALPAPVVTVIVFASSATLYFCFLRGTSRRLAHAALVFVLVEAIDRTIPLLLGAPVSYALSNWIDSAIQLCSVALGFGVAQLSSNNSFKPKPLRGSA